MRANLQNEIALRTLTKNSVLHLAGFSLKICSQGEHETMNRRHFFFPPVKPFRALNFAIKADG